MEIEFKPTRDTYVEEVYVDGEKVCACFKAAYHGEFIGMVAGKAGVRIVDADKDTLARRLSVIKELYG